MKNLFSWILFPALIPWLPATAEVIHIDIEGGQTAGTAGNFNGTPATVLGAVGDTWNYVTPGNKTAGSLTDLKDSTNAPTTVDIEWTANHWSYDNSTAATVPANYRDLLGDYVYINNGGSGQASSTWTFKSLVPNATYNLVIYAANGTAGGSWTVNGETKTTSATTSADSLNVNQEYVRFDNVQANASGELAIGFAIRAGQSFGEMSGLEIEKVAVGGPPNITVPATVSLTPNGAVQQYDVTVNNTSADTALAVSNVQFSGANAAAFSPITALPLNVAPNSNATLSFSFNPAGLSGAVAATMALTSNDPDDSPKNIAISGFVADPVVAVTPAMLDFGSMADTDPAADLPLDIYNDGVNNNLTVSGSAISDASYAVPSASAFSIVTPPGGSVVPGSGTTATLRFNPAGISGRAVSLLNFTTNDPVNPNRQVILTGVTPLAAGALSDNFDSGYASRVWDNPWDVSTFANGHAEFTGTNYTQRQYIRTVAADFANIDFTVTATVHRGNWPDNGDASLFFGIGKGVRNNGFFFEPSGSDSVYLRLRSLGWTTAGNLLAEVNNGTSFTSFGVANNATGNSVPLRVSYKAATHAATFTLDVDGDGFETSDPKITATNTNLSPTDSHLFAGGSAGAWVDDVVVTLGVADPYTSWADGWSSPALSDKTPGGDPDFDGIRNLMEYLLGGDPRVASSAKLPSQSTSGGNLVLAYTRNDDSETGSTQTGQWSTDFVTWNDIAPVLVNENGTAADNMEIRIPLTNAAGGKLFGRLHVTQP